MKFAGILCGLVVLAGCSRAEGTAEKEAPAVVATEEVVAAETEESPEPEPLSTYEHPSIEDSESQAKYDAAKEYVHWVFASPNSDEAREFLLECVEKAWTT